MAIKTLFSLLLCLSPPSYDVNGPYIPLSYAPGSCQYRTGLQECHCATSRQTQTYLIGWCLYTSIIKVPVAVTLEKNYPLLHIDIITNCHPFVTVLQVLHCCVSSSNLHTQQSHYLLSLSDLSTDYDLILGQVKSFEPPPSQTTITDFSNLLTVAEGKDTKPSCCSF